MAEFIFLDLKEFSATFTFPSLDLRPPSRDTLIALPLANPLLL